MKLSIACGLLLSVVSIQAMEKNKYTRLRRASSVEDMKKIAKQHGLIEEENNSVVITINPLYQIIKKSEEIQKLKSQKSQFIIVDEKVVRNPGYTESATEAHCVKHEEKKEDGEKKVLRDLLETVKNRDVQRFKDILDQHKNLNLNTVVRKKTILTEIIKGIALYYPYKQMISHLLSPNVRGQYPELDSRIKVNGSKSASELAEDICPELFQMVSVLKGPGNTM